MSLTPMHTTDDVIVVGEDPSIGVPEVESIKCIFAHSWLLQEMRMYKCIFSCESSNGVVLK